MDISNLTVKEILELGAFGVLLVTFLFDRFVGEPRRMTRESNRLDSVIKQFKEERKEDRAVLLQLAQAVSKLEVKLGDGGGRVIEIEVNDKKGE